MINVQECNQIQDFLEEKFDISKYSIEAASDCLKGRKIFYLCPNEASVGSHNYKSMIIDSIHHSRGKITISFKESSPILVDEITTITSTLICAKNGNNIYYLVTYDESFTNDTVLKTEPETA